MKLRNCPYCDVPPEDHYVYYQCPKCGLAGPWSNGGKNDTHADHIDNKNAANNWNQLWFDIRYGEDSFGPDDEEDYYNE